MQAGSGSADNFGATTTTPQDKQQEAQLAAESPPQGDGHLGRAGKPTIKIGNYILKETLGRGTFGKVKRLCFGTFFI